MEIKQIDSSTSFGMTDPRLRGDDNADLHLQFIRLGGERNKITYKLLALLPKIYKQGIYRQKGYQTIYEYAGKLAGLSHSVVKKTLNLDKHLKDKPFLQKAIETQGVHKVALVARLATLETDKAFADKVENMSKNGLQELSKEVRYKGEIGQSDADRIPDLFGDRAGEGQNLENIANFGPASNLKKCFAAPRKITIELDEEMQFLFLKLKQKLGENLSNKEVLRKILKQTRTEAEGPSVESSTKQTRTKESVHPRGNSKNALTVISTESPKGTSGEISGCLKILGQNRGEAEQPRSAAKGPFPDERSVRTKSSTEDVKVKSEVKADTSDSSIKAEKSTENVKVEKTKKVKNKQKINLSTKPQSRYIPVQLRKTALQRSDGRCDYPNCNKPAQIFHHTKRFAGLKSHESIICLCKEHHEFAHNGMIGNESSKTDIWSLKIPEKQNVFADVLFRKYRNNRQSKL